MKPSRGHPERRGRPRAGQGGFTLIELMVVLILVGMVGTTVVISWQALLPNQNLNSAVRVLSDDIYGARSNAISFNHEYRIYYDLDNQSYRIRTPYREGGGFAYSEDEQRVWISHRNLAENGVSIESVTIDEEPYYSGQVYVRFDPLGASSNHRIVLKQDQFDRFFTLEVLPLTGEVRFQDGIVEREPPEDRDFQ